MDFGINTDYRYVECQEYKDFSNGEEKKRPLPKPLSLRRRGGP
jgi:hypothetical protein